MQELQERATEMRARAMQASKAGKKSEAMQALKRAKGVEAQLATCQQTHSALERQVDMLAESELQREIATALSASVTSVKKKSKGLLSKTETAVDDSQEVMDANDDLRQVLSGLQPSEVYDDDELADELAEMMAMEETATSAEGIAVEDALPASDESAATAVSAFPAAPKKKVRIEEKSSLLADDGATGMHASM